MERDGSRGGVRARRKSHGERVSGGRVVVWSGYISERWAGGRRAGDERDCGARTWGRKRAITEEVRGSDDGETATVRVRAGASERDRVNQ